MRTNLLMGAVAVLVGFGCTTYDFEPVRPFGVVQTSREVTSFRDGKPNIMVLLDKSGSMARPIDGADARCTAGCGQSAGNPCPAACPTRISELRAAMGPFLSASQGLARFGLSAFPTDSVCGASGAPARTRVPLLTNPLDVASELQAKADEVNASIQRISASATGDDLVVGGTPTGGAVALMGDDAALADPNRPNFVLLLTDGLPNCNAGNAVSCTDAAACQCTLASCGAAGGSFCTLGCLDDQGTTSAIAALAAKKIKTIVVGFGAETGAAGAFGVLDAMGRAGGFERTCASNSDCGSGGCDLATGSCNTKFFQARDGAELARALADFSRDLPGACDFTLDVNNPDPALLTVRVDEVSLDRGASTWQLMGKTVTLLGTYCDRVRAATPTAPVKVSIRVLESL